MLQTTQLCQAQIGGLQRVQSGPVALCDRHTGITKYPFV